jgi:signal peptidase I
MQFDFELFLVLSVLITGVIALYDIIFMAKHRLGQMPKIIEYSHSFFPVLLIVLLLRSFLMEPFRIPTGSLEPSLIPGDFIASNKYEYGLRLPVSHTKIFRISEPKAGEIVVFKFPVEPDKNLIKRIIGVGGDKISYQNKVLTINGVEQPQKNLGRETYIDENGNSVTVERYQEIINGVKHDIYTNPQEPAQDFTVTVPQGEYFAMGDNRDNSLDSRYWGFVPEGNLIGKAFMIWFSWDSINHKIRWNRMFEIINKTETNQR